MSCPARRACAIRWMIALVEQPIAIATVMAFSKAFRVWIFAGVKSSHTISTMRRPHSEAMRIWPASAAGIEDAPGSVMPNDSAIALKVRGDRFGNCRHGRCGAHGHAGAIAAGDAGLDIDPVLVGNFLRAPLIPVFP